MLDLEINHNDFKSQNNKKYCCDKSNRQPRSACCFTIIFMTGCLIFCCGFVFLVNGAIWYAECVHSRLDYSQVQNFELVKCVPQQINQTYYYTFDSNSIQTTSTVADSLGNTDCFFSQQEPKLRLTITNPACTQISIFECQNNRQQQLNCARGLTMTSFIMLILFPILMTFGFVIIKYSCSL